MHPEILALLNYLAELNTYEGFYAPERSGIFQSERIEPYLNSRQPIVFESHISGRDRVRQITAREVLQQLQSRKGLAFELLTHLGLIYSTYVIKHPHRDSLTENDRGERIVVLLSDIYELEFVIDDHPRLSRCVHVTAGE